MAKASKPFGLRPMGTVTGATYNEQGNLYYIANDASNTYAIGDVVKSTGGTDANGVPAVVKATSGDVPRGIIVGFRVADPGVSLVGSNLNLNNIYLPKNAGARYAYVVDDPNIVFWAQLDNTAVTLAHAQYNSQMTITADDTTNLAASPISSIVLTGGTVATTNTFIVRMLGVAQITGNEPDSSTVAGAYTIMRCKWNMHEFMGGSDTTGSTGFTGT